MHGYVTLLSSKAPMCIRVSMVADKSMHGCIVLWSCSGGWLRCVCFAVDLVRFRLGLSAVLAPLGCPVVAPLPVICLVDLLLRQCDSYTEQAGPRLTGSVTLRCSALNMHAPVPAPPDSLSWKRGTCMFEAEVTAG